MVTSAIEVLWEERASISVVVILPVRRDPTSQPSVSGTLIAGRGEVCIDNNLENLLSMHLLTHLIHCCLWQWDIIINRVPELIFAEPAAVIFVQVQDLPPGSEDAVLPAIYTTHPEQPAEGGTGDAVEDAGRGVMWIQMLFQHCAGIKTPSLCAALLDIFGRE
jgi:hypothetical protein